MKKKRRLTDEDAVAAVGLLFRSPCQSTAPEEVGFIRLPFTGKRARNGPSFSQAEWIAWHAHYHSEGKGCQLAGHENNISVSAM